jgi:hypothetical protein
MGGGGGVTVRNGAGGMGERRETWKMFLNLHCSRKFQAKHDRIDDR